MSTGLITRTEGALRVLNAWSRSVILTGEIATQLLIFDHAEIDGDNRIESVWT